MNRITTQAELTFDLPVDDHEARFAELESRLKKLEEGIGPSPPDPDPPSPPEPPDVEGAIFCDPEGGRDSDPGTEQSPIRHPEKASNRLKPGQSLLLKAGTVHRPDGAWLIRGGLDMTIGRYGPGPNPIVDGQGVYPKVYVNATHGLLEIRDCGNAATETPGVRLLGVDVHNSSHSGITIRDTAELGEESWGNVIESCHVFRAQNSGIKITGVSEAGDHGFLRNTKILNCDVEEACLRMTTHQLPVGGEAISMRFTEGVEIRNTKVHRYGKEGIVPAGCEDILVEGCFVGKRHPDTNYRRGTGSAISFDRSINCVARRNLIMGDPGGAMTLTAERSGPTALAHCRYESNITAFCGQAPMAIAGTGGGASGYKRHCRFAHNTCVEITGGAWFICTEDESEKIDDVLVHGNLCIGPKWNFQDWSRRVQQKENQFGDIEQAFLDVGWDVQLPITPVERHRGQVDGGFLDYFGNRVPSPSTLGAIG